LHSFYVLFYSCNDLFDAGHILFDSGYFLTYSLYFLLQTTFDIPQISSDLLKLCRNLLLLFSKTLLDLLNFGPQVSINARNFHSEFLFDNVDLGLHIGPEFCGGIGKIHRDFKLAFGHLLSQL
jgi:hypothetical protein